MKTLKIICATYVMTIATGIVANKPFVPVRQGFAPHSTEYAERDEYKRYYLRPLSSEVSSAELGKDVNELKQLIKQYIKKPHKTVLDKVVSYYNLIAHELKKKKVQHFDNIDFQFLEKLVGHSYAAKLKEVATNEYHYYPY